MFTQADASAPVIEPRLSATILLIRDAKDTLEVLLMRRNSRLNFCAGFWVFPGGAVDVADADDNMQQTLRNAAVRETQEEAGITIQHDGLLPLSRWVTPEGASKRFDTWFYLAAITDEEVRVDGSEIIDSIWVTCEQAIALHRSQEVELLPPTLISLMGLAPFTSTEDALSYYRDKPLNSYFPKVAFDQQQLVMLYPGDAGYDSGDVANTSGLHRCTQQDDGWHYHNAIGVQL